MSPTSSPTSQPPYPSYTRHHGIYPPFHVSLYYSPWYIVRLCRRWVVERSLCLSSLVVCVDSELSVSIPSILCRFCDSVMILQFCDSSASLSAPVGSGRAGYVGLRRG